MNQGQLVPSDESIRGEVLKQIDEETPAIIIDAIVKQIIIAIDARNRIDSEGLLVKNSSGSAIPHPAIKIEQDAIKLYTSLLLKVQE